MNLKIKILILITFALLIYASPLTLYFLDDSLEIQTSKSITREDLQKYIKILTSDRFEGRETSYHGGIKTSNWIKRHLLKAGLFPFKDPYSQKSDPYTRKRHRTFTDSNGLLSKFFIKDFPRKFEENFFRIGGNKYPLHPLYSSYYPGDQKKYAVKNEILFVGDGQTFEKIRSINKDVLFDSIYLMDISSLPIERETPNFRIYSLEKFYPKIEKAVKTGARGIIFFHKYTKRIKIKPKFDYRSYPLLIWYIQPKIFSRAFPILDYIYNLSNNSLIDINLMSDPDTSNGLLGDDIIYRINNAKFVLRLSRKPRIGHNILTRLISNEETLSENPDSADQNANENNPKKERRNIYIISHYDGLGYGYRFTSPDKKKIHPGAYENASSIAIMMELSQYFSGSKEIKLLNCFNTKFLKKIPMADRGLSLKQYLIKYNTNVYFIFLDGGFKDNLGWKYFEKTYINKSLNTDSSKSIFLYLDGFGLKDNLLYYSMHGDSKSRMKKIQKKLHILNSEYISPFALGEIKKIPRNLNLRDSFQHTIIWLGSRKGQINLFAADREKILDFIRLKHTANLLSDFVWDLILGI